jgi:hypothetical protein
VPVFKGVIGIVAPPRVRPGYEETGGDDGPMVDEEPPDPRYPIKREDTTHFDLDPKNGRSLESVPLQLANLNQSWLGRPTHYTSRSTR